MRTGRHAVIYEIYPRSFGDTNGDGRKPIRKLIGTSGTMENRVVNRPTTGNRFRTLGLAIRRFAEAVLLSRVL